MSPKALPEVAVVASTPVPWIIGGPTDGLVSLGLGLLGVLLARTIFVNRENKALGHRQPVRETLPITLAACLIAGGLIWDGHLLYSKAIGVGVAVGWSTIVVINQISRIVNPGDGAKPVEPARPPLPSEGKARPPIERALRSAFPVKPRLPQEHRDLLARIPEDDPPQE